MKLGKTVVVALPGELTRSAGTHVKVELGSLPSAEISNASPRHIPPSSEA